MLFSTTPLARRELAEYISSAHIGVAFYSPAAGSTYTQKNISVIGLSSGKVSSYLAAGLPVITNSASTLGELVQAEGIRRMVEGAAGIPDAIRAIDADYGAISQRAVDFFDSNLDFRGSSVRLWGRIHALR